MRCVSTEIGLHSMRFTMQCKCKNVRCEVRQPSCNVNASTHKVRARRTPVARKGSRRRPRRVLTLLVAKRGPILSGN